MLRTKKKTQEDHIHLTCRKRRARSVRICLRKLDGLSSLGLYAAFDAEKEICFLFQGDEELRQGMTVLEIFDRRLRHRFPQSQYRFIEIVVEPLFHGVRSAEDLLKGRGGVRRQITQYLADNLRRWKAVAQGAEAGASSSEDTKNQAASQGDSGRDTSSSKPASAADTAKPH